MARGARGLRPAGGRAQQRCLGDAPQGHGTADPERACARRSAGRARSGRSGRGVRGRHPARADPARYARACWSRARDYTRDAGGRPRNGRGRTAAKWCWSNWCPAIPRATSSSARAPPRKTEYRTMNPAVPAVFKPELKFPSCANSSPTRRGVSLSRSAPTIRKRIRNPGISKKPAGAASWSSRLPELAANLRRLRKAKVFEVACSSPDRAGQTMQLHVAGAVLARSIPISQSPACVPIAPSTVKVETLD